MKNPKKYFEVFSSGASRIAGFGEGTPQQDLPQGQNRRYADFGTVVESCSEKTAASSVWVSADTLDGQGGILPAFLLLPLTRSESNFRQVFFSPLLRLENDFWQTRHMGNYENHKRAAVILLSLPTKPARGKVAGNAATFFLRFNTDKIRKRRMTAQIFRTYPSTAIPRICQSRRKKAANLFQTYCLCAAVGAAGIQFSDNPANGQAET